MNKLDLLAWLSLALLIVFAVLYEFLRPTRCLKCVCGGTPRLLEFDHHYRVHCAIENCSHTALRIGTKIYQSREAAILAWNARVLKAISLIDSH